MEILSPGFDDGVLRLGIKLRIGLLEKRVGELRLAGRSGRDR